ncbi:MAG: SDR family oxidoreductase [Colwellia sp.]|jgi:Nucleoside-diphosphate-sugar epimerases
MNKDLAILITGASGFFGRHLLRVIDSQNVRVLGRTKPVDINSNKFIKSEISGETDFSGCFKGVEIVIHCAARAHIMTESVSNPLWEYRSVNTFGTLRLAQQAAKEGVNRFIYLSSIKVNGETTTDSLPYTEQDCDAPQDFYGVSKMEAEHGLRIIAAETGMEVVIIRPPLVYGPGVKANFLSLLKLSSKGLPLPFGAVHNQRSMVYVDNLVYFVIKCIDHPAAANETFLVSDGDDVSLTTLLKYMGSAFGRAPRLVPIPVFIFKLLGMLAGKQAVVDRLVGDLQADSSKARMLMDWKPPFTVEQGIQGTVDEFLKGNK